MKLELELEANAAYFEMTDAEAASTQAIESGRLADCDAEGPLIGIEVLSAAGGGSTSIWITPLSKTQTRGRAPSMR